MKLSSPYTCDLGPMAGCEVAFPADGEPDEGTVLEFRGALYLVTAGRQLVHVRAESVEPSIDLSGLVADWERA